MTSDEIFKYALGVVLESEGGLSLDERDAGNWTGKAVGVGELKGTNHGISAAAYPHLDIAALTREDAAAIYRRDYFDAIGAGNFPPALAVVAFDIAVNHGPGRLRQWLREAPQDAVSLSQRRLEHYISLSHWSVYSKGWSRRVFRTLRAAQMLEVRAKAEAETLLS